jgi:hypothetical protein
MLFVNDYRLKAGIIQMIKCELCTLRVEYIAHYGEGGHTGLLLPVCLQGEGNIIPPRENSVVMKIA